MLIRYGDESQLSHLTILCNTGDGGVFSNVRLNLARGYRKIAERKAGERPIAICASGPSLSGALESIRAMQKRGVFVLAMNGSARYLNENGIKPDAMAMVDPRPDNVQFVSEAWAAEAWLASQCHPDVTDTAEKAGMRVMLWHPGSPRMQENLPANDSLRIGGGITIGMCSMSLSYVAGFRELHMFGFDSSHTEGSGHAFPQPINANDELVDAVVDSRKFVCSVAMAKQASDFMEFTRELLKQGCELHVHGEGLIPSLWNSERKQKALRPLTAVYDLGVSPPSYDFISFLVEAERYRVANNFDVLDVAFQPGPMHGFRSDDLPPDAATREGMLWRVCVGISRLLPSVRNVAVLRTRMNIPGDVFPVGWSSESPVSHYGTVYLKGGEPMLRASEAARKWAEKTSPYATITLRHSSYWPTRNSNFLEWKKVAEWLKGNGIESVFIPDTEASGTPASFDVDLRAALYEGAVINLGVANGPMYLLPYLKARYLIFNIGDGSTLTSSTEFLLSHGVTRGDETAFGGNGKAIWLPDTFENIVAQLGEFEVQPKRKTL